MQLFCTLGNAWAIVPEAFLNPTTEYHEVHVLTTASAGRANGDVVEAAPALASWFATEAPEVALTFTRIQDLNGIDSLADHQLFEEALYRWYLQLRHAPGSAHLCLAGGFKTISSSVQKMAGIFGAAELFHVLCKNNPRDAAAIASAHSSGLIQWVSLGPEPGWPALRHLSALSPELQSFPTSEADPNPSHTHWLTLGSETTLLDLVTGHAQRIRNIQGNFDRLATLPFPELAAWNPSELDWLDQPLDPVKDAAWVSQLPKIELHCHLGGFATHGAALLGIESATSQPLPERKMLSLTRHPEGWPLPATPISLPAYMQLGDDGGSRLLRDPACLDAHIRALYQHLKDQNVAYAEIRCSPANYAKGTSLSPWDVLVNMVDCFSACRSTPDDPHVNLIIIATRRSEGDYRSAISRHLSLAVTAAEHWTDPSTTQVVGVDLAGFEHEKTRAHYFREDFTAVHRCGLAVTVHAGENDDAESIWSAVFDLNARRLGHALRLADAPDLLHSVASRGIGVEMCPYANLQIRGYSLPQADPNPGAYPLLDYLAKGIPATVNTDNIGISAATLSENICLLSQLCPGITRRHILQLISNAVGTAFLGPVQRERLRKHIGAFLPRPG